MAGRQKRRVDVECEVEEEVTPVGKRPKPAQQVSAGKKLKKSSLLTPPVFEIEATEEAVGKMPSENAPPRSPKPPSAEEFKLMLREGLANLAKKEQLDTMMLQIKGNSEVLQSLEDRVESNNNATERRFLTIEERINQASWPVRNSQQDESRRARSKKHAIP